MLAEVRQKRQKHIPCNVSANALIISPDPNAVPEKDICTSDQSNGKSLTHHQKVSKGQVMTGNKYTLKETEQIRYDTDIDVPASSNPRCKNYHVGDKIHSKTRHQEGATVLGL